MNLLVDLLRKGGPAMIAILVLSVVLYSRCFKLVLTLRRARRRIGSEHRPARESLADLRLVRDELQDSFRHQRVALGAMIAAAPLLGLLGTVSGMAKTFDTLASRGDDRSMEGLAQGISEVLVATESGLTVALPALLIVYLAHREVRHCVRDLNQLERRTRVHPHP